MKIQELSDINNPQALSVSLILKSFVKIELTRISHCENIEKMMDLNFRLAMSQFEQIKSNQNNQNQQGVVFNLEIISSNAELSCSYLKDLLDQYFLKRETKIGNIEGNNHKNWIFSKFEFLIKIISLCENTLCLNLTDNQFQFISLGNILDPVLNKAKKYSIKSLSLMLQLFFETKTDYEVQFVEAEKIFYQKFIQQYSDLLKFFLTQIHLALSAQFSKNLMF